MSKIGKQPIQIPEKVEVKEVDGVLEFKSGEKTASLKINPFIKAEIKDGFLTFFPLKDSKQARSNWGTIRALANNAIKGLANNFEKILEIEGVGYRAAMEGENITLSLGFSHPIKIVPPKGIKLSVEKNTVKISGSDKALVGKIAAEIRKKKKVEPYKGKGIKYQGEIVRRKAGKKMAAAGAK
jgi:large subunit ribosomal protein L6